MATEQILDIPGLVRSIFLDAVNRRASDVHIDPSDRGLLVRFRIDGSLAEYALYPLSYHEQVLTHIKVSAELNTTQVFTPQDGHFSLNFMYQDEATKITKSIVIDIRISVFPTIHGDAAVFRLANSNNHILHLNELGMDAESLQKVQSIAKKSNGMLLVTGPVGSGKTSALYSVLNEVLTDDKNAITLEDPVEFRFEKVRQIQINPDRGLTFASGMKSILRQDPDIIMIGEIRDAETAEYAVRAALVGRTVFSTLHTNSSVGTIARLLDMNIDKSLIAYALNGVIASRLARKVCQTCKETYVPSREYLSRFQIDPSMHVFYRGKGCIACGDTGYRGRIGIFEVLEFDSELRSLIVAGASMSAIEDYVSKSRTKTLQKDALDKVFAGITTLESIATLI